MGTKGGRNLTMDAGCRFRQNGGGKKGGKGEAVSTGKKKAFLKEKERKKKSALCVAALVRRLRGTGQREGGPYYLANTIRSLVGRKKVMRWQKKAGVGTLA